MAQITLNSSGVASNGTLALQSNGTTTAVTIDTSQNVGVGTASPAKRLSVVNATDATTVGTNSVMTVQAGSSINSVAEIGFSYGSWGGTNPIASLGYQITSNAGVGSGALTFSTRSVTTDTAPSERMRIDSSGNVGIGTSSPSYRLHVSDTAGIQGFFKANSAGSSYIRVDESAGTLQSIFGTDGTAGFCGMLSNHAFTIRTNNTERMRIDTSGNLLVGTTSALGGKFSVSTASTSWSGWFQQTQGAGNSNLLVEYSAAAPNNSTDYFGLFRDNVGQKIQLRSNGGIGNYSANNVNLSDRREKTNFAPAGDYLSKICAIPVQTYNYIDQNLEEDGGLTLGVVAQDVQVVAPELVNESNWGTEEEPKMRLSIYQTDLQYALMKCIQEQQAIITSLTDRITALEAK